MDINRVLLVGFAGKDATTASTSNGKSAVKLSLATTKRYKDSANQWREKTQWHDCAAYGELATSAVTVKSGAHLLIEGHLVYREYERRIETDGGPVTCNGPLRKS